MKSNSVWPLLLLALLVLVPPGKAQEAVEDSTAEADEPAKAATGELENVVIPVGTRLGLLLQNTINTKTAAVGDPVYFESIYPIVVNNRVLIPVGSYVRGSVTYAKRPGRIKGRGELHLRFDELILPNGYTVQLSASLASAGARQGEEVDREEGRIKGDTSKGEDVGTVATTGTTGAGVGAIAGGGKGAAIGGAAGAAAGLAATLFTRGRELELPRGTTVDVVLDRPLELDAALARFDWTGQGSGLAAPDEGRGKRRLFPRLPF